ncbi:MAG: putative Heat shock protein 70, partial [Streblomastix strix]
FEGERSITKDNHPLGNLTMTNLPPAKRGEPQIEVTFEIDANSILSVTAEEKAMRLKEHITITNDKSTLSQEDIDQYLADAEKYAEEDRKNLKRVQNRNAMEEAVNQLKRSLDGEDEDDGKDDKDESGEETDDEDDKKKKGKGKGLMSGIDGYDRKTIEDALEENKNDNEIEPEEIEKRMKVLSDAINPILEKHGKITHQSGKQQQAPSSSSTVSKQQKKGNKKEENKKKGKKDESDSSDNSEL